MNTSAIPHTDWPLTRSLTRGLLLPRKGHCGQDSNFKGQGCRKATRSSLILGQKHWRAILSCTSTIQTALLWCPPCNKGPALTSKGPPLHQSPWYAIICFLPPRICQQVSLPGRTQHLTAAPTQPWRWSIGPTHVSCPGLKKKGLTLDLLHAIQFESNQLLKGLKEGTFWGAKGES